MISGRRFLALSGAILVLSATLCVALDRYGRSSRVVGAPVAVGLAPLAPAVVATSDEAFGVWRRFHGRTLLYVADGWSRIDPNRFNETDTGLAYPLRPYRPALRLERRFLDPDTFLYVAGAAGIVRRIVAVVSPESYGSIRESARLAKNSKVEGGRVYLTHQGFPRWFSPLSGLRPEPEPVLLFVGASAFRTMTPQELLRALRERGIRSDAVVLSRMEVDRSLPPEERERLEEFRRLLARGGR